MRLESGLVPLIEWGVIQGVVLIALTLCIRFTNLLGLDYGYTTTKGWPDDDFVEVKEPQPGDVIYWPPSDNYGGHGHMGIVSDPENHLMIDAGTKSGVSERDWRKVRRNQTPKFYRHRKLISGG